MTARPLTARIDIEACADRIEALQDQSGAISWIEAGVWDPWNHGESVMGLAIAGREEATHKGLDALEERQLADGAWLGELGAGIPMDESGDRIAPPDTLPTAKDSNFTGYVAVTVLRAALALDEPRLIARHFPMVERAMDHVISLQSPQGDIAWRDPDPGQSLDEVDALIAGNACLFKSLECGLRLADALDKPRPHWAKARAKIARALTHHPDRFDRKAIDRSSFAMDWYYPVMSGVVTGSQARQQLQSGWDRFVVEDLGCRCVSDEPWITAAESAELALACLSVGWREKAVSLVQDIARLAVTHDGYWMGWQYDLGKVWPLEQPSWTAAAAILAEDAVYQIAPGHTLLIQHLPASAWLSADQPGAGSPAN